MSNKALGSRFERELAEFLAAHGFWAHVIAQNAAGQPADIIACKDDVPYLIDCKVCSDDRFPISRIEPNQEAAMTFWQEHGNTECYFAMKTSKGIYMIHWDDLKVMQRADGIHTVVDFSPWMKVEKWVEC